MTSRPHQSPRILDANKTKVSVVSGQVRSLAKESYIAGVTDATSDPLENGTDQVGRPLSRSELTENSIVDYYGKTRVKELVSMGVLEPDKQSGGYRWTGRTGLEQEKAAAAQQAQQEKQEASQAQGLGVEVERTMAFAMEKLGDTPVIALYEATMRGNDVSHMLNEYSNRLGLEPHETKAHFDRAHSAILNQAKGAAYVAGVEHADFDGFVDWAMSNKPQQAREAFDKQFYKGNLSGVRALAKEYAASGNQYDEASVLTAELGEGIRAWRDSGSNKVVIAIPGHGSMLFRDAVRDGLVRVSTR